jgi:hypothetical protein
VTDIWNNLPQEFVQKNTVKSFEILLDKHWENQGVKYDYNGEIKDRTGSHKKKFIVDIDEEDAVERPALLSFLRTWYIIYWYVLYNFWKYLFVKIAARVLGPNHIVVS